MQPSVKLTRSYVRTTAERGPRHGPYHRTLFHARYRLARLHARSMVRRRRRPVRCCCTSPLSDGVGLSYPPILDGYHAIPVQQHITILRVEKRLYDVYPELCLFSTTTALLPVVAAGIIYFNLVPPAMVFTGNVVNYKRAAFQRAPQVSYANMVRPRYYKINEYIVYDTNSIGRVLCCSAG